MKRRHGVKLQPRLRPEPTGDGHLLGVVGGVQVGRHTWIPRRRPGCGKHGLYATGVADRDGDGDGKDGRGRVGRHARNGRHLAREANEVEQ